MQAPNPENKCRQKQPRIRYQWPPDNHPPGTPLQDERLEQFCAVVGAGYSYKRAAILAFPDYSRNSASMRARALREYPAIKSRCDYLRAANQNARQNALQASYFPPPSNTPPHKSGQALDSITPQKPPPDCQDTDPDTTDNHAPQTLPNPDDISPEEYRALVSRLARAGNASALAAWGKIAEREEQARKPAADPARVIDFLRGRGGLPEIMAHLVSIYGHENVTQMLHNVG